MLQVLRIVYYPGFTVAGISEPLAVIAAIALLALTDRGSSDFRSGNRSPG